MFHVDTILTVCKPSRAIKEWTPLTLKVWLSAFKCRRINNTTKGYLIKWFKHYNEASDGHSFQQLISEKDYESIAIYWWILEQLSKFEDRESEETSGKITLKFSYFKMKLGQNRQRITKVLLKIGKTFDLEVSINLDESVTVFVPKWLELQETRGGKREAKLQQSFSKNPTDIRSKTKEERSKIKELENTISPEPQKAVAVVEVGKSEIVLTSTKRFLIKKELLESWSETYPKEFLELSLKEMKNWILVNDAKAPKSQWGKFMNGWFQRGWERHRKTMASNPTSKISETDLNEWLKG